MDLSDWQAYFEERAAIREFDGELPRHEAEELAFEETVTHWLYQHPVSASNSLSGCIHCSLGERPDNTLVAVLAAGDHLWVHDQCWAPWHTARRRLAAQALGQFGLFQSSPDSGRVS